MNPIETELRNVEWEIYQLYRSGVVECAELDVLWARVDNLDATLRFDVGE